MSAKNLLLLFASFAAIPNAFGTPVTTTLNFTGSCNSCVTATATLTLVNYTFGSTLLASNFQEFTYQDTLADQIDMTQSFSVDNSQSIPFSFTSGEINLSFSGSTGGGENYQVGTDTSGNWAVMSINNIYAGSGGTWSTTASSAPEPASLVLIGLPFLTLAVRRFRKRV